MQTKLKCCAVKIRQVLVIKFLIMLVLLIPVGLMAQTSWYVNDNSTVGDVYTSAVGNDANPGTAAAPFAKISDAISAATAGDIIYVDVGTYSENLSITKNGLNIKGPNSALNNANGTRVAEAIITSASSTTSLITVGGSVTSYTIDGFKLVGADYSNDGNGSIISAVGNGTVSNILNNTLEITSNATYAKRYIWLGQTGGSSSSGSEYLSGNISHNSFTAVGTGKGFAGITMQKWSQNFNITGNKFAGMKGHRNLLIYHPTASVVVSNNEFSSSDDGSNGGSARELISSQGAAPSVMAGGITIQNNSFSITGTGKAFSTAAAVTYGANISITNNDFGNVTGTAINNGATGEITASCNWWGSGDPAVLATTLVTKTTGNVYEPSYLDANTNTSTTVGFQPGGVCKPAPVRVYSDLAETNEVRRYFTIQPAIDAATTLSGYLVRVHAGTYTENVDAATLAKNISLAPGSSPGCVTINGNFTLNSGDNLNMEINSTVTCTGHDKFTVTGTVNLAGATLNLTLDPIYTPDAADRIVMINNEGTDVVTGMFAQGSSITVGGYKFSIIYNGDTSGSGNGNDVVLALSPSINCPSVVTKNTAVGICTEVVSSIGSVFTGYGTSVGYSVTGATTVTGSNDVSGTVFAKGVSTVTYTVTDVAGQTATCSFSVAIIDDEDPTITAPANVTVYTDDGICTAALVNVSLGTPTTSDNCSVTSTVNDATVAFVLGSNTVIWTVTDASGNTATDTQLLTVLLGNSNEINLQGNAVNIVSGDSSPDAVDDTDFGSVALNTPKIIIYTIQNTGIRNLIVSGISISGTDAASYTVGGISFPETILPGGSTTFTVTISAGIPGVKAATVTITSSDCDEGAYSFAVVGNVYQFSISSANMQVFSFCPGIPSDVQTFSVSGTYLVTSVIITAPTDFEIRTTGHPNFEIMIAVPIDGNGYLAPTSVDIRAAASATVTNTADISLAIGMDTVTLTVTATANPGSIMDLRGNTVSIVRGDSTPNAADGTQFGSVTVNVPIIKTYTIQNTSNTDNLVVSAITLTGPDPGSFVIGGFSPNTTIAPGSSTTFTITFTSATAGLKAATVVISSNDKCNAVINQ